MKKLFALATCSLLVVGLSGCNKNKGETIDLVYSGTASDKDFNTQLFEDFKAARKAAGDNNTYNIEYIEHGPDKVDSEIQDWTTGPDVFEFASDKITDLYAKGALSKLSSTQSKWVKDNNSTLGANLAKFNKETYAYPYTGDNTYYFQYDKSIITNPEDAKSVEKILEIAEKGGYKFGYNLKEAFWGGAAMFTFGADYSMTFDADGSVKTVEADFDGANGLKAAKGIQKIIKSTAWSNDMAAPTPENKFIGCIAGTWDIASYKSALGDNYACAPMPTVTVDGETKNLGAFLGGKLLGVNSTRSSGNETRTAAAHELAKFLSGKECQLKRFENGKITPCNKEAANDPTVLADENVKVLIEHAAYAHEQTAVPGTFWSAPGTFVTSLTDGTVKDNDNDTTLKAALTTMNNAIKSAANKDDDTDNNK